MKKIFLLFLIMLLPNMVKAQDSTTFKGTLYNDEYKIFIKMDFYNNNIMIPDQEIFGSLAGYIGSRQCTQVWPIVECKMTDSKNAEINIVNNYGSEDLTCTLSVMEDGKYELNKKDGSTLKFPVRGKWQKIPGTIILYKANK